MLIVYEGTDITSYIDVRKCVHRDVSGGRSDCAEIEFEHSERWFGWEPKIGETIRIIQDNYDSGILYLNTILPEGGRYRMLASSVSVKAGAARWQSFREMNLGDIMRACAAECGMDWGLYGVYDGYIYPYLLRRNEGCLSFLNRLMEREGAVLKCVNGKITGIGIEYAQSLDASQTITINSTQGGALYRNREAIKLASITLRTPYAQGSAIDAAAAGRAEITISELPAADNLQAKRWARGLLMSRNRQAERLEIEMELNTSLTAMTRIDIDGNTPASGKWLVDEVEHDLQGKRSSVQLLRCMEKII